MTPRAAQVLLGDLPVGELVEDDQEFIEFRVSQAYRDLPRRPVIGQWFEDHPRRNQRGTRPGELPAFFANLIPEGDLRVKLEERLGVTSGDDFGFLCAVGRDLPGAVVVHGQEGARDSAPPSGPPERSPSVDAPQPGLRFSLAGVQLKFSMTRHGNRFTLPGKDERGEWIAKIAFDSYPDLCAVEWTTMEWARLAGFDVPLTELRTLADLVDVPDERDPSTAVLVVRRYDRTEDGRRVHQEDFQQIVGRRPHGKYDDITCEGLVLLATRIAGDQAYAESIRRLAFVVASGNNDAHMKNWSVVYPDGIQARLSPLYDQVFTARWPMFQVQMALKLGGTKEFAAVDAGRFGELARRLRRSPEETEAIATRTVAELAEAWGGLRDHPAVSGEYREALQRHWRKVPLLRPHALLV